MKWLICVNLFIMSVYGADDITCGRGKLSVTDESGSKIIKERFCTNKNGTVLMSENFDSKIVAGKELPPMSDANPGWVLCRSLGGVPEMVDIEVEKKWLPLDRCVFPDKSYVDCGHLVELTLSFGKAR